MCLRRVRILPIDADTVDDDSDAMEMLRALGYIQ